MRTVQPADAALFARSRAADAALFDLVEQGLIADAEYLGRLAAIPVNLSQRLLDGSALGLDGRRLGHRGE